MWAEKARGGRSVEISWGGVEKEVGKEVEEKNSEGGRARRRWFKKATGGEKVCQEGGNERVERNIER